MKIRVWGSRGSIPVSGKEYLKYGGDTTCVEILTKSGDTIVIDAGTGIRRLGNKLAEEKCYDINFIFTHAHWDHLMGFPFFKPLYFAHSTIRMHRCPFHNEFVETILSKVMSPPNFPVKYSDITAQISYLEACPTEFEIGSVTVVPIALSHPNGGSGYKFIESGKSFIFLTDNELGYIHPGGLAFDDYLDFAQGADLLIHDAEYTPEEYNTYVDWGHSVYTDTLDLALKASVKKLGLFHLNQERTDEEMDKIVEDCRGQIKTRDLDLECVGVSGEMEFEL
ncbi:MAG: MBL fold metallo-hydrolase [Desulfobacterales bacterium]|nr:MAG: MBL fold metallo-hydrolase [Desulfobacterales bacterium]